MPRQHLPEPGRPGEPECSFEASGRLHAKALHLNERLEAACYSRGNDELKQKEYRQAIRGYTRALKLYPTGARALMDRGPAWKELGKAEKDRRRATEIERWVTLPESLYRSRNLRRGPFNPADIDSFAMSFAEAALGVQG